MSSNSLEEIIRNALHVFYKRRIDRLNSLKLEKDLLSKKNPYLFRAMGTEKAAEILDEILKAFTTSSDETIFGAVFFEPVAKAVSIGIKAPAPGIDIAIETETRYTAISMKSGTSWGNSSQLEQQDTDFNAIRKRLFELQKQFDPVVGHGYGRKNGRGNKYRDSSGQAFWREITGDADFYLKLIRLMKDEPQKHKPEYRKVWDLAFNRLEREFLSKYVLSDGSIDWEKLVKLSSEEKIKDKKP